ncbi:MAG: CinA family protein [Advenella sp.]|nr:nicotinamide-nucleotide amidohydrolase family protein [Advenella sp. FME57]
MLSIKFVARYMADHDLSLVTAESCTAGLIASTLSEAPNAGRLLDCAFVTYTVAAKEQLLNVSADTIEKFNLTSEQVAREMAVGALARSPANVAVSNTGVVDDIDPAIRAGTQCYAWAFRQAGNNQEIVFTETRRFTGSSRKIRKRSALYALSRIPFYTAQALGNAA